MEEAILASGSEMVTVIKRIDLETETDAIISHLKHPHIHLLPNTSGARNAKKLFCGATGKRSLRNQLVKTRNSSRPKYLPDAIETLKATEHWLN
jgi:thiazole synthase